jgi:hypothetical protein
MQCNVHGMGSIFNKNFIAVAIIFSAGNVIKVADFETPVINVPLLISTFHSYQQRKQKIHIPLIIIIIIIHCRQ